MLTVPLKLLDRAEHAVTLEPVELATHDGIVEAGPAATRGFRFRFLDEVLEQGSQDAQVDRLRCPVLVQRAGSVEEVLLH